MASLQSWRKAYGALKDTTTVSLANLNSDFKEIDVAIVKATNHVECPPKDRYLRKILLATSAARPRADVAYCVRALSRRIAKTHNWTVALKALMLIHRVLREGDPTFREELLVYTIKGRILQLSNFKDDSSPIAWDCSAWVRTYAQFLEERLECFRSLRYDVEAEPLIRPKDGTDKGHSRTRTLNADDLLDQLPVLQQLLYRLVGCQPEGAAANNHVIQYALALVLKESFKIYCAINDGIINLVDKFFEMPRHEAFKAVEIYRRAGQQAMALSEFYEVCRGLEMARNFQFPNLREPPPSFLATMDEYLKEAPRIVPVTIETLQEIPERLLLTYKPEDAPPLPEEQPPEENIKPVEEPVAKPTPEPEVEKPEVPTQKAEDVDLLGLGDFNASASALEDSNALALAIVPPSTTSSNTTEANAFDPTGWELALVTTSSGLSTVETNLAGGLDKLTLESLYDEGANRQQKSMYGATCQNPFMANDPFATSNQIAAPPSVQMASMAQQQQQAFQPSPMMMQPNSFGQQFYPQQQMMPPSSNPFGDVGFGPFPTQPTHQQSNPFGNTGLL